MKLRYVLFACTGLLTTGASVPADIVWSGGQNLPIEIQYIDLNKDALIDVILWYELSGNNALYSTSQHGFLRAEVDGMGIDGSNHVLVDSLTGIDAALPYATLISTSPDPSLEWKSGMFASGLVSEWDNAPPTPDTQWRGLLGENGNTYVGIEFEAGEATHYGWVNVALGPDEYAGFSVPIIHGWAYESTPDTPIAAGAIPEPSSGILTLIGSLGILLISRARRRGKQGCGFILSFRIRPASAVSDEW